MDRFVRRFHRTALDVFYRNNPFLFWFKALAIDIRCSALFAPCVSFIDVVLTAPSPLSSARLQFCGFALDFGDPDVTQNEHAENNLHKSSSGEHVSHFMAVSEAPHNGTKSFCLIFIRILLYQASAFRRLKMLTFLST